MSTLDSLNHEIESCTDCELASQRTRVVPGEGPEHSSILFIGEAPGFHEDQEGRPFVGAAGRFLEQLLASINLRRDQVFIANVVKCRPPNNRDPLPGEIQSCRKWLDKQIEVIKPKMIVTLGRYSMVRFFPGESIGKIHGKARKRDSIIYFPMYHPAAALHQGSLRQTLKADMLKVPELLAQMGKGDGGTQAKQLGMF
ncbi:MAG: uracil-DNA glycosylase [Chloroflexi bacterium]|nr:uracil-DNA glycosylase [Chloroflexota bacterium]